MKIVMLLLDMCVKSKRDVLIAWQHSGSVNVIYSIVTKQTFNFLSFHM